MEAWKFIAFIKFLFLATCSPTPIDIDTVIKIPEACRNKQYCPYKPDGYELLETQMNIILRQFLKEDNRTRIIRSITNQDEELSATEGTPSAVLSPKSDWHNCPYETQRKPIYMVNYINEDKNERALIVQTNAVRQEFDMVTCAKKYIPDGDYQCFQHLPLKDMSMKSVCEEVYATRNVYIYNQKEKKIQVKHIPFPVSCSCTVSYKHNKD